LIESYKLVILQENFPGIYATPAQINKKYFFRNSFSLQNSSILRRRRRSDKIDQQRIDSRMLEVCEFVNSDFMKGKYASTISH